MRSTFHSGVDYKLIKQYSIPVNYLTKSILVRSEISIKFLSLFGIVVSIITIVILSGCSAANNQPVDNKLTVQTVHGSISPDKLGLTLSHEHLFSNFGLPIEETSRYDEEALFSQTVPYLRMLHDEGVQTIIDYTTAYFGRRADLLQVISDSTGIQIVTNTGIYGGANDRYVPAYAFGLTAEELSEIWIDEAENGIEDTGIRPGFIKLAFDDGEPSEIDQKLFEAGLMTHLKTGLTVAVHTGSNPMAVELQLELLEKYGVDPSAWIWTHANWHDDLDYILEVAQQGAWISMDGVKSDNIDQYIEFIERFEESGVLNRLLLSHDGDIYPAGGNIRPLEAIPKDLTPAMRSHGFSEEVIEQIFVKNPGEAYSIRIEKR
jgi:phosphotriesterase-related protein